LAAPYTQAQWLDEPALLFANGKAHVDPKIGIPLYGPRSFGTPRHKSVVHVGFIGTANAVDNARKFFELCSQGVSGDENQAPFPGCTSDTGFRCNLLMPDNLVEPISRQEERDILAVKRRQDRFEHLLLVLRRKLEVLTQRDHPLDYIVLVLTEELYRKCRVVDYVEKGKGMVHRDLRRAFKSLAMEFQKPTQILLEPTTGLVDTRRKLDHQAKVAWNLFTGMYFKVDALPWGPSGLPGGSCFVGISFYRPLGDLSNLRTSLVQAFDENGEGLVLRGHKFTWNEEREGKSPHLSAALAGQLIEMVLERYKLENKNSLPRRIILHKTSRFEPEEQAGFEDVLTEVKIPYDLVSLCPTSEVRLLRMGQYPPLRGTVFSVGDVSYCYTSGYLRSQGGYPHGHVPSPIQVADHIGDTSRVQLLQEVLTLTKMNWNSANMFGLMPITLRFSRLVGDILREVPEGRTPQPKFMYYM
jgi:hypothetical protein